MVAYKNNNPDKIYKKQDYQLSAPITGIQLNPSSKRYIANNATIDGIVEPPEAKNICQNRFEPEIVKNSYDLTQPIWFEEIMKKLANYNIQKAEKDTKDRNRHYICLN